MLSKIICWLFCLRVDTHTLAWKIHFLTFGETFAIHLTISRDFQRGEGFEWRLRRSKTISWDNKFWAFIWISVLLPFPGGQHMWSWGDKANTGLCRISSADPEARFNQTKTQSRPNSLTSFSGLVASRYSTNCGQVTSLCPSFGASRPTTFATLA